MVLILSNDLVLIYSTHILKSLKNSALILSQTD